VSYLENTALEWVAFPAVSLSCLITLLGGIGMCECTSMLSRSTLTSEHSIGHHKRPDDVHWHLTLTLDWFNFVLNLGNLIMSCRDNSSLSRC
jgi:hypothetical protein